ncbi:MAG TPA: hypothetical protein VLN59_11170, partial [Burkholderiales bacterium]|nr:hypothetical protein [Burkholderiales bacterium]
MSKTIWWSIVIFGSGLVAAILFYAIPKTQREPELPTQATAPAAPAEPQTHFPIPQEAQGTV